MKRSVWLLLAAVPLVAVAASWNDAVTERENEAVRQAVQHYFDGMMQANPDVLRRAFHNDARLMGLDRNGGVLVIPFERWANGWGGRDPRDVTKYKNAIVSVDIEGTAASVKTDLEWPNVHYVDYLSLLKINGEWKIVNKIWWEERR